MAYDPSLQFRCDIVRSRARTMIDDLLPEYARIIHELCPCPKKEFDRAFNEALKAYLKTVGRGIDTKAINNQRTETAKTLFGMYYIDSNEIVHESERTTKYLKDGDQPAFFKDFCYKLQFPNGMTVKRTLQERIDKGIKVYPCRFLLAVLRCATNKGITLNIKEIGYYVLNSEDVLCGKCTPSEVVSRIKKDRAKSVAVNICSGVNDPWDWEHIQGILNYLELANLITVSGKSNRRDKKFVTINSLESATVKFFADRIKDPLLFDVTCYDLNDDEMYKQFQLDWDVYNASLSGYNTRFSTSPAALGITLKTIPATARGRSAKANIGKAGESYVFEYEVERVKAIDPSYAELIKDRSSERGIGFDIESIYGDGVVPTRNKYIEVKTTTRVTAPTKMNCEDALNITRNEWIAAQKYEADYFIYRVYLTKGKVFIFVMGNIAEKERRSLVHLSAPVYEMRFQISTSGLVDEAIEV